MHVYDCPCTSNYKASSEDYMKLTLYTDYSLRVMIHLAVREDELVAISQIAQDYGISHNNLMKIVNDLSKAGFIKTVRGRNGGIRMARSADDINLGDLVRHTESSLGLVDCSACLIVSECKLPAILEQAKQAFLKVFDAYTVADITSNKNELLTLFNYEGAKRDSALACQLR